MIVGGLKSNLTEYICPACSKNLRYKPPCCSDKRSYYVCPCGYKKVKDETNTVHNSGGGHDSAGM